MQSIHIGNIEMKPLPHPFEDEPGYCLDLPAYKTKHVDPPSISGLMAPEVISDHTEVWVFHGRLNIVFGLDKQNCVDHGDKVRAAMFVMDFRDVPEKIYRSMGIEDGVFIRPAGEDRLYRVTGDGVFSTDELVLPTGFVTEPLSVS